jgi:hypothetical protein
MLLLIVRNRLCRLLPERAEQRAQAPHPSAATGFADEGYNITDGRSRKKRAHRLRTYGIGSRAIIDLYRFCSKYINDLYKSLFNLRPV